MAEKKINQTPLEMTEEKIEDGSPVTINTALFRAFLELAAVVGEDQAMRLGDGKVSFKSRNKGNTAMAMITLNTDFHNKGEIGIRVGQILAALPKTENVTLTFGGKISLEGTDYKANFLLISPKDPTLVVSKLKRDFSGENGFIVGSKDFFEKATALKAVFRGDRYLSLVSSSSEPGIMILTTEDNSVGDVHYRVSTSCDKEENWTRMYDYDMLIPALKAISQYTQEVKVEWLPLPDPNSSEPLMILILSGQTSDGAINFSYALAPRIPIDGAEKAAIKKEKETKKKE